MLLRGQDPGTAGHSVRAQWLVPKQTTEWLCFGQGIFSATGIAEITGFIARMQIEERRGRRVAAFAVDVLRAGPGRGRELRAIATLVVPGHVAFALASLPRRMAAAPPPLPSSFQANGSLLNIKALRPTSVIQRPVLVITMSPLPVERWPSCNQRPGHSA